MPGKKGLLSQDYYPEYAANCRPLFSTINQLLDTSPTICSSLYTCEELTLFFSKKNNLNCSIAADVKTDDLSTPAAFLKLGFVFSVSVHAKA